MILQFLCFLVLSVVASPLNKRDAPGFVIDPGYTVARSDFDAFISSQPEASMYYLMQNVNFPGSQFTDGKTGVVVASPSTSEPNYYYQWTRDTAITYLTLLSTAISDSFANETYPKLLEYYISNSYDVQRISNPTGSFDDPGHKGVGEPKYMLDNTAYTDNWGRPQSDGPALRSYCTMKYLKALEKYHNGEFYITSGLNFATKQDVIDNIVKPDLDYVITYWNETSYDLWEELMGSHFFTSMTQLKALTFALSMSSDFNNDTFVASIQDAKDKLQQFIESDAGYINASLARVVEHPAQYTSGARNGLDCGTLAAVLLTNPIDETDKLPISVSNSYYLNSLYGLMSDFKTRYTVNANSELGVGIGRYPEDTYNGVETTGEGNPWFLCTAYGAQTMYQLAFESLNTTSNYEIPKANYDFYNRYIAALSDLDSDYASKDSITVTYGSENYKNITQSLKTVGDSFLKVILNHINDDGELAEEFDRTDGLEKGAVSLTWSSGSFLDATRVRSALNSILLT